MFYFACCQSLFGVQDCVCLVRWASE